MRFEHELKIAKGLAIEAGKALRSFERRNLQIGPSTQHGQVVTIADLIADDIIVSGLQEAFCHDAICSEQMPVSASRFECDRLWLVDALDGNTNFVEHGDDYALSIGLVERGKPILGVVYNPARRELFAGSVNQPTTLNGAVVKPGKRIRFEDAIISMPCSEWAASNQELQSFRPIASTSYALARVAAGMDDIFFANSTLREWSTCAGVALVNASGGSVMLSNGAKIAFSTPDLSHQAGIVAGSINLRHLHSVISSSDEIVSGLQTGEGANSICPAA